MVAHPLLVCAECFFQSACQPSERSSFKYQYRTRRLLTVVSDVLPLSVDSIDLQSVLRDSVVAVLIDDTLRVVSEVEICLMIPPVFVVAVFVELTSAIIEAMSDLVSDNKADGTEVQIAALSE